MRDQLVRSGTVDDTASVRLSDGNWAGVGDRIVTRLNDRDNTRAGGSWPTATCGGSPRSARTALNTLSAARVDPDNDQVLADQRVNLEGDYVGEHVQLE